MDEIRELYQETLVDHSRSPRNFRAIPDATVSAEGYNPLCGDRVHVFVKMSGDRIADVAFQGSGCAISTASASLMTEAVKGKHKAAVEELIRCFHDLVTGQDMTSNVEVGKLEVFQGVRDYPTRVKCAVLAWHALGEALSRGGGTVSTE